MRKSVATWHRVLQLFWLSVGLLQVQFFSSSFDDELQPSVVQVTSDSYLVTATASTVLPSMLSFDLQHCTGNE